MKRVALISGVAAVIFLVSAGALCAGVVMSEIATASGPVGNTAQQQTVYVQGNKQKIDADTVQTIADLDKRLLYIVDKNQRNYVELPLRSLGELSAGASDDVDGAALVLKRTGKTHVVAYQRCDEYRGTQANEGVQVSVSACVSKAAPGAKEVAKFDREMIAQLTGARHQTSNEEANTGLVLEKKSVVNLRVPDQSRQGYRSASVTTRTRVKDIKLKQLPAETFAPPKGFDKVNKRPADLPEDVQSIALTQPLPLPAVLSTRKRSEI
jgi:hypothetical protein